MRLFAVWDINLYLIDMPYYALKIIQKEFFKNIHQVESCKNFDLRYLCYSVNFYQDIFDSFFHHDVCHIRLGK